MPVVDRVRAPRYASLNVRLTGGANMTSLAALLLGGSIPAQQPVEVTVLRTITVWEAEEHLNFPWAFRGPDGFIALNCSIGQHTVTERGMRLVSEDDGETWTRPTEATVGGMGTLLSDGRAVMLSCWNPKTNDEGAYLVTTTYYAEGGRGPGESVPGAMALPFKMAPHFHRSLVELPDGDLIATIYGRQEGHTKYTSAVVRTEDGGKHWGFLSTIAHSESVGSEGFCEPTIERLANGDLLCAMRVGGPLHICRSTDGGQTWSAPVAVADHGVCPDLLLLSNGVLVLSFGRPNVDLLFSPDGTGNEWVNGVTLYRGQGCSYTSLAEGENGDLMVFFSQSGFCGAEGPGPLNMIRSARLSVRRPGAP
jgi:hypothetical protein